MPLFLISYDLNKNKDYKKIIDELESHSCHRALESLWLGDFNNTAQELLTHFKDYVDEDDGLVIAKITKKDLARRMNKAGTNDWLADKT